MDEGNSLLDVALETLDGRLQEGLLLGGRIRKDADGTLGSIGLEEMISQHGGHLAVTQKKGREV